jgi:hypothetical protein
VDSSEAQPRATRPGDDRWWLPPVIRLLLLVLALAAAATAIWLALRHVDAPSAQSLISDYGYWGVAIGSFGDSFGLPSSGEVVVLLASAAAAGCCAGSESTRTRLRTSSWTGMGSGRSQWPA